ncbi:MAG: triose-phosphate isomerase, partial [Rhodospirillaceae bacterium]|nr:triose-phosphate isomerase [Rhodospirillaceae bacterium]
PVWAIGTGKTPTLNDIEEMHSHIRKIVLETNVRTNKIRILYGGSVKPNNAAEIFELANVDGALVGGASLSANDFMSIIEAGSKEK